MNGCLFAVIIQFNANSEHHFEGVCLGRRSYTQTAKISPRVYIGVNSSGVNTVVEAILHHILFKCSNMKIIPFLFFLLISGLTLPLPYYLCYFCNRVVPEGGKRHSRSYLQSALHQLVDVQEGLFEQLHLVGEYPDNSLPLQNKEPLGSVPTVDHSHRLPQTTQHLLGTVAVVFVFPG